MTTTTLEREQPVTEAELREAIRALEGNEEILLERLADIELMMEDKGWDALTSQLATEFSRDGLIRAAQICRAMAIVNPLIKRGLSVRQAYIFGSGIEVVAPANGKEGSQDVAAIVKKFWDDVSNIRSMTGSQAQEELERVLGTDGNVFLACFTTLKTGRVEVRSIPFDEIVDVIYNPEDRDDPWFYKRQWTQDTIDTSSGDARTARVSKIVYYPDLNYRPKVGRNRPKSINGNPIEWNAPIYHIPVNRLDGWKFGIGDAFASTPWARAYKTFLEDWATLVKALSRFAWKAQSKKKSNAQNARTKLAQRPAVDPATGKNLDAGGTAVMTEDTDLVAIPKTGATIDSDSGRPLATMVASGLDVPVTTLLADPGQTGARAVAETLNQPTRLAMMQRRSLWTTAYRSILSYVIDCAIRASKLKGRQVDATDSAERNERWELENEDDRFIDVDWPDIEDKSTKDEVEAIVNADSTGKMPDVVTLRLLLSALHVEDVDKVIEDASDEDGNLTSNTASAAQAAVKAFRQGQDPAAVL